VGINDVDAPTWWWENGKRVLCPVIVVGKVCLDGVISLKKKQGVPVTMESQFILFGIVFQDL
jgi:hypothetical protein